ncbi:uncharacterized protein LOC132739208 [Ruditapes philippinarum]|uniref:uncharacterized protein LOC132739208 n=1 Tax=Ruditapes philippinarum TaxID=129788 RepID=UPI00295B268C|nr:uncharacterized protein LOC132739208 [Ruditapes philippinarum]
MYFSTKEMFNVAVSLLFIFSLQKFLVDSSESSRKWLLLHSQEDLVQRLIKVEAELVSLKNTSKQTGYGSTYVRWGRNTCPVDNKLVYTGYTAGRYFNTAGSGTTNLCLPDDPKWANYVDGNTAGNSNRGHIYGAEIDIEVPNQFFHIQS